MLGISHSGNDMRLMQKQAMTLALEKGNELTFSEHLYPLSFVLNRVFQVNDKKTLSDRVEYIRKNLKVSHCQNLEGAFINYICQNYPYQFYVEGDNLGSTGIIKHYIKLIKL